MFQSANLLMFLNLDKDHSFLSLCACRIVPMSVFSCNSGQYWLSVHMQL